MEDNELEEGEAFFGQEVEEATTDPDIALSYIDEKIQNVLGHFQKDFEGGVCAENLGAKFGGYGSFLPSHQRSPLISSQHRSPQKTLNYSTSRSPYDAHSEGVHAQKTETPPPAPVSSKSSCLSTAISLDNSGKKDACGNGRSALESSPQQCLASRQDNHSDQRTLKVRVKLGPDKISSKNNAAIYSGLGLDVTPSPSLGESIDDSLGSSPISQCAFVDSPTVIYEFYTCLRFALLDSYMLSPISKSLLYMEEKDLPQLKECKTGDDILNCCNLKLSSGETPMPKKVRSSEKIAKPTEKNLKPFEVNKSNVKDVGNDISAILKSEIDIETTAGREIVTSALDIPLLSVDEDKECQLAKLPVKAAGVSRPTNNTVRKEKIIPTDVMKDQDSVTSLGTNSYCNGRNEHSHVKTKLSVKPLSADKSLKDRKFDILKDDTINGPKKDGKRDVDKNSNVVKVDCDGNKTQKDQVVRPVESDKMKAPQRTVCSKEVKEKSPQGKGKSSGRRKSKGGEAKEYTTGVVPMMQKDKEKNLYLKDLSDIKSKPLKSQNASNNAISRECFINHVGLAKVEQAQVESSQFLPRDKPRDLNLECKTEEAFLSEKIKEKTGSKKCEISSISESSDKVLSASLQFSNIPTSTLPPFSVPHVIEDHWVACDECEKWRLLPYEINPNQLPKTWRCSMLYWLPGMNRCSITEEETTKALLELYRPPVVEGLNGTNGHHDIKSLSAIATCSKLPQNHDFRQDTLPGDPKKKFSQMDVTITNGQPNLVHFTSPSRENQLIHAQNRSTDSPKNKLEARNKMSEIYSDGGDSFEQRGKHSRSKSRREFNQDKERDFKRIKVLESHHMEDDCNNHSLGGETVPNSVLTSKASGKNSQNHKKFTASKNSKLLDLKEKSLASGKNMKAPLHIIANGRAKEQHSSLHSEKSDATKKRKVKNWQESGIHPQISEADVRKDKKVRVSKSDGQIPSASKSNAQSEKVQLPCGFQDQLLDGFGNSRGYADKDHQLSRRNADVVDSSLKKDLVFSQPSTAATSSSSKVSDCHKCKANFQEVRDSPVESVSSSPLRISNSDILPTRRNLTGKDDSIHVGYFVMGSPRRSSEGEADGMYNHCLLKSKGEFISVIPNGSLESNKASESSVLDPTRGACDLQAREMDASKAKNQLLTKIFGRTDDELSPSDYEEINRGDGAAITPMLQYKHNFENQGKGHGPAQEKLDNPYHISGSNITKKSCKSSSSQARERHKSSKIDKDKMKTSNSFNGQEGLHPRKNKDHARYSTAMDSNGRYKSHVDVKDKSLEKEQKSCMVKICGNLSSERKRDGCSTSKPIENMVVYGSSPLSDRHGNSKVTEPPTFSGNRVKPHVQEHFHMTLTQEDERSSNHLFIDHMDKLEMGPGTGKLESAPHPAGKQDSKNQTSCTVLFQGKESRSDMHGKADNGSMDNGLRHPLRIKSQNGANHNSLRNVAPNRLDAISCSRKEGGSSVILKEARRLKQTANQLKIEGLDHESTGLYFQAALKFLHVALLLENSHSESTKHGDQTSIQMYSYTAKLCEFCAHEYEKRKQIAACALAYKCMEVAYMKVVYFKHHSASKDHHELHVALNGESPSSSASDVDNLINSSMIDKVVPLKGLLSYAEDVIYAMEASKKSLNAFAAAHASLDGSYGAEVMSSVKKVIDYNFHDVEGLLRLVRLSVELVSS